MTDLRVSTPVTLGVVIWRFIVWRNKSTASTPASTRFPPSPTTIVRLPQTPDPTHLAYMGKFQDYTNRIPSPNPSLPPVYSPGPTKSSPTSSKKSTPSLSLDVNCEAERTQPSPLRSASFNPSIKTQLFSSSRVSMGAKKLYVIDTRCGAGLS